MAVKRANTSRRSGSTTSKAAAAKRPVPQRTPAKAASQVAVKKKAGNKAGTKSRVAAKAPAKAAAPARKAAPAKRPKVAAVSVANEVSKVVEGALDEMKAVQVKVLDVRKLTDIADTLIIASGNSDRHVRSIADRVLEHAKKAGLYGDRKSVV